VIGAVDWVARSTVAAEVLERWPAYRAYLVAVDDVDVAGLATVAEELLDEAEAAARAADGAEPDEHVDRWRQAYRDFGVKPRVARASADALIRRAGSERGLPRIGTLVDLYNAVSVLERVPIGGEDLDRYDGPASLVLAAGDEPFHTTVDGEVVVDRPEPGEPVWIDAGGVTCRRWNWRQTTRTAIGDATRRVGFIVDSLDAPEHPGAQRAVARLVDLLPGATTVTLGS
jgi:DNA/RNA-binding domain of Phe-tRNA-synthetase-like protein